MDAVSAPGRQRNIVRDMPEIAISALAERKFLVEVGQEGRQKTHRVTVPERLSGGLELTEEDPAEVRAPVLRVSAAARAGVVDSLVVLARRHLGLLPRVRAGARQAARLRRRGRRDEQKKAFASDQRYKLGARRLGIVGKPLEGRDRLMQHG
jgi:hypothetical protein